MMENKFPKNLANYCVKRKACYKFGRKKKKTIFNIYTPVTAAGFTIAKKKTLMHPFTDEQIKKMWYIYKMEY